MSNIEIEERDGVYHGGIIFCKEIECWNYRKGLCGLILGDIQRDREVHFTDEM